MNDIIQLLPDSVANQIAAGEVIQRPSSVVKELMENAIDAKATNILVNITDAGKTAILVSDNGIGMSDTDARLAFERHATSKIKKADDLFTLQTMGFRGEALPSIAAVAQVEVKTRQKDSETGTQLIIHASKVIKQQPIACTQGCSVNVQNLFYNLPARRKFLKSDHTELNHIIQIFQRIVLVYPDISFQLTHNNIQLFQLPKTTLQERIADIFGKKIRQQLLPINTQTSICNITGYVGKPESARKKTEQQFFFTNGRYMRHPYFHKAVTSVYERLIPQGHQIPYYIYIDIDPANIDVNIHPTKTEIKFEDEQAIWQILASTVRNTIGRYDTETQIDFDTEGKPDIPLYNPITNIQHPTPNPQWQQLYPKPIRQHTETRIDFDTEGNTDTTQYHPTPSSQPLTQHSSSNTQTTLQYKGRFIITPVKSGLMLIDQHRAHQRIRYEEYLDNAQKANIPTQQLLFPQQVEITPAQMTTIEELLPTLSSLGFEVRNLGGHTLAVYSIPADIPQHNIATLISDIIENIGQNGRDNDTIRHNVAWQVAKQTALTIGEVLTHNEMESIVNRLFRCTDVHHTPDGKPILHIIQQEDFEKNF